MVIATAVVNRDSPVVSRGWELKRSTFRSGNCILRFSCGFGLLVRDPGEWRPGFYTEFRCASREHSGLAWGAIFEKVIQNQEIHTF